jgi:hypothetical protein
MLPLSEIPNDVDRGTSGTYPACIRRVGLPRPPNSPKNSRPCVEPLRRSPGPRSSCTCSPSTGIFFLSDLYVLVTWPFPAPQRLLKGETFLFGQTSTTIFSFPGPLLWPTPPPTSTPRCLDPRMAAAFLSLSSRVSRLNTHTPSGTRKNIVHRHCRRKLRQSREDGTDFHIVKRRLWR